MNNHHLAFAITLLVCCRSAPEPTIVDEPTERPLPPASGTPIGILLDEGSRFALRADQREKLQDIDRRLSTRNEHLSGQLRAQDRPRPPGGGPPMGGGGRMGGGPPGGGMGGGGMGGPPMGGGGPPMGGRMGGPPKGGRRGSAAPPGAGSQGPQRKIADDIATSTRAAIDEALAILDDDQRAIAEKILRDRGAMPAEPRHPGRPSNAQQPDAPTGDDER